MAVLGVVLLAGFFLRENALGPVLGLSAITGTAALIAWTVGRRNLWLGQILALAFVLRVAAALADHTFVLFPKADQNGYFLEASWLAAAWHAGTTTSLPWHTSVGAYVHLLAPFFWLFGPHVLVPRFLSALLGLLAILLVHHIARPLLGPRPALMAAAVYALFPTFVYVQSETLRDPVVHVLILLALWALITPRLRLIAAAAVVVAAVAGLAWFRFPTLLPMVAVILILTIQRIRKAHETAPRLTIVSPALSGPGHVARWTPMALFAVSALSLIIIALLGASYLELASDGDAFTQYRSNWAQGGSGYLSGQEFNNAFEVLLFAPIGAIYFLFTPFPWQVHNGLALIAAVHNVVLIYPLVILAALGLRAHQTEGRFWSLVLFLVLGAMMYGLVEGNAGTALRHRTQFTWVLVLLAAPVMVHIMDRLRRRAPASADVTTPGSDSQSSPAAARRA